MPSVSPHQSGPWTIQEEETAFRIVDRDGRTLAQIPFADRSAANLSKAEAKLMAERMVAARDMLAKAGSDVKS